MAARPGRWCGKCRTVHSAGEDCPQRQPFARKRAGDRSGRGGSRWRRLREAVFRRDKFLCQICLKAGRLTAVELHGHNHGVCDHIIPEAEGGSDDPTNLQTICQLCDRVKTSAEAQAGRGEG